MFSGGNHPRAFIEARQHYPNLTWQEYAEHPEKYEMDSPSFDFMSRDYPTSILNRLDAVREWL